jgi:hypothetical protein
MAHDLTQPGLRRCRRRRASQWKRCRGVSAWNHQDNSFRERAVVAIPFVDALDIRGQRALIETDDTPTGEGARYRKLAERIRHGEFPAVEIHGHVGETFLARVLRR